MLTVETVGYVATGQRLHLRLQFLFRFFLSHFLFLQCVFWEISHGVKNRVWDIFLMLNVPGVLIILGY